jgi:hypothetical protein
MGREFCGPANANSLGSPSRKNPGVGPARREKSEFGLFRLQVIDFIQNRQGKSLEILGKSLEKAWKSLQKAWKSLEILGEICARSVGAPAISVSPVRSRPFAAALCGFVGRPIRLISPPLRRARA